MCRLAASSFTAAIPAVAIPARRDVRKDVRHMVLRPPALHAHSNRPAHARLSLALTVLTQHNTHNGLPRIYGMPQCELSNEVR